MELFQLEAFLAVVREGSFSAAAKALFRTQPAISQTIKKLEDEIGRPLFDRSSRRGVLTDAGRVLADHARIPFPTEVAWAVAGVQLVGGAFVLMGLFSRVWGLLMSVILATLFVTTSLPVVKA